MYTNDVTITPMSIFTKYFSSFNLRKFPFKIDEANDQSQRCNIPDKSFPVLHAPFSKTLKIAHIKIYQAQSNKMLQQMI